MNRRTFLRSLAALALAPAAAPLLKRAPEPARQHRDFVVIWRNHAYTYQGMETTTLEQLRRAMKLTTFEPPRMLGMGTRLYAPAPDLWLTPAAAAYYLHERAGLV